MRPIHPKRRALLLAAVLLVGLAAPGAGQSAQASSKWKARAKAVKVAEWPAPFRSVTARPGKKPGTAVVKWRASEKTTSYYRLDMASTVFHPNQKPLPKKGRNFRSVKIPRTATSYTISAKLAAKVGAPLGSGNHIFYRFYAVNSVGKKRTVAWPGIHATATAPLPPTSASSGGGKIRIASFNVASVRATLNINGRLPWVERRNKVARSILNSGAGIIALQELGPGNIYDGGSRAGGTLKRQTDDLVDAVNKRSPKRPYALVRRTAYYEPGLGYGSQGMRILYDTTRFQQLLDCPDTSETTNRKGATVIVEYSRSCSFQLPIRSNDRAKERRTAGYAKFRDLRTGKEFYVVSVHLDPRPGTTKKQQRGFGDLRAAQARYVVKKMKQINTEKLPVFVGGDLNSWQNQQQVGASAHRVFVANGYYDGSATRKRQGMELPTTSGWARTTVKPAYGFGSRIDYVLAWGVRGSLQYKNTMVRTQSARGSDHSLVWATFRLP